MDHLYLDNPYLRKTRANIIEQTQSNEGVHIVLDKTVFRPGEIGAIGSENVIAVFTDQDKIIHRVAARIPEPEVTVEVDERSRAQMLANRTASAIIEGLLRRIYAARVEKIEFDLKRGFTMILMDTEYIDDDFNMLVTLSNAIVRSAMKTRIYMEKNTRMLEIPTLPPIPWNEYVADNTGEVGGIALHVNRDNGVSLTVIAGAEYEHLTSEWLSRLGGERDIDEVFSRVLSWEETMKKGAEENAQLKEEVLHLRRTILENAKSAYRGLIFVRYHFDTPVENLEELTDMSGDVFLLSESRGRVYIRVKDKRFSPKSFLPIFATYTDTPPSEVYLYEGTAKEPAEFLETLHEAMKKKLRG